MDGTSGVMTIVLIEGWGVGTAAGFWLGKGVDFVDVDGGGQRGEGRTCGLVGGNLGVDPCLNFH